MYDKKKSHIFRFTGANLVSDRKYLTSYPSRCQSGSPLLRDFSRCGHGSEFNDFVVFFVVFRQQCVPTVCTIGSVGTSYRVLYPWNNAIPIVPKIRVAKIKNPPQHFRALWVSEFRALWVTVRVARQFAKWREGLRSRTCNPTGCTTHNALRPVRVFASVDGAHEALLLRVDEHVRDQPG